MQRSFAMNLSINTTNSYEVTLRTFRKFLADQKKLEDLRGLQAEDLRAFFIVASETMNGETRQGVYRRLNTFFNFLVKDKKLIENPLSNVEKPKRSKRIIQSFNSSEVSKMLTAYDVDTFIGRRNYTILSLLLATGLRRSEYISLKMYDVDLSNDFIRVIGKGDKERIVPIGKALSLILRKYVKARKEYLKGYSDTPYFIISKYRKGLSKDGSNSIFSTLRKELKLTGKRFSAHTWRHTFAKAFLLNGGDVFTLQELLGHEDVETTKVYVDLADNDKAVQNNKYNPLDNTKWQYY
ncbi:MAG: tyrosine-type recombinase/integrase [Phascolarctobacterium sp.]|nr:tyrosine-type recombinase/integrase [Phascolarctobacterium sp.]